MMNAEIFYIDPTELTPYQNNAKIHTDEQVEQIVQSIKEFGFNDPIGIDQHKTIIEGHGRYLAALKLGMNQVPVFYINDLTEEQKKAYSIVHNQTTALSQFDNVILQQELDDITSIDMAQFSFSNSEETYFDPLADSGVNHKPKIIVIAEAEQAALLREYLNINQIKFKEKNVR